MKNPYSIHCHILIIIIALSTLFVYKYRGENCTHKERVTFQQKCYVFRENVLINVEKGKKINPNETNSYGCLVGTHMLVSAPFLR